MADIMTSTKTVIGNAGSFVKKHWVMITIGLIGLWIIWRYAFSSSSSGVSTDGAASAAALQNAYSQAAAASANSAQNAQIQLAAQTEADSAKVAMGQVQVANTQAIGQNILAIGSTIAGTIGAQLALPGQAIAAATATNQTALMSSAAVAAQGVASLPDSINATAHLLGVQTGNFGTTLIGFGANLTNQTGNAVNAVAVTGSNTADSAARASANAANANAAVNIEAAKAAAKIFGGGGMLV